MLLDLAVFVIAAIILSRASILLVETLTKIAIKLKISEFLVGFVLVAIGSSLPELLVGIVAALEGKPLLSLGNIIGSNIANLTIVLGIPALIAGGIRIRSQVRNREIFYMNILAIAPLIVLIDGTISQGEGALLILLFVIYLVNLALRSTEYSRVMGDHEKKISLSRQFVLFAAGLIALVVSADLLIRSGSTIATTLGIPSILIGLFILAFGTSLPELSFDVSAAIKRDGEILMGETLGSVVSNATLVLGITALIRPITIENPKILLSSAIMLLVSLVVFTYFVRSQYKVSIKEGIILILGYILFVIAELLFGLTG